MDRKHDDNIFANAHKPIAEFDFDAWAKLAQSNPEAFEQKRSMAIEKLIAKMDCRDDRISKMRTCIEQQRDKRPPQEVLPWMMQELSRAFSELNEEFNHQVAHWPK